MVNMLRSHQRWLMIVVSILVIVSFIWYFSNTTRMERFTSDRVGTVYGEPLTVTEFQRMNRMLNAARQLGLANVSAVELTRTSDPSEAIVNQLVMIHQAEAFGIEPSDDEVQAAEQNMAVFKGPAGTFDSTVYTGFIYNVLMPFGMTEAQLEELVRRDLKFAKLRQLLDATVLVSPLEVRTVYEQNESKTEVSILRLDKADFQAGPEPSDDEVKKAFDAAKDQYQKPEQRKVQYVAFVLDDAQKRLENKERMPALQALGDQATDFMAKMAAEHGKSDFAAVAAEGKLSLKETPDFEESEPGSMPESSITGFADAAFKLSKETPESDVPLRTPDGFYLLHLTSVTSSRPMTLEEAKPKVIAMIKDERSHAALTAKAEEIRTKIEEGLSAKKPFDQAARDAGQTPVEIPPFSAAEPAPNAGSDQPEIADAASGLQNGELSKFTPTNEGGLLVYVKMRYGVDEKLFDQRKEASANNIRRRKGRVAFIEWLQASREAANARFDNPRG